MKGGASSRALLIVVATAAVLAYLNAFGHVFVYDDLGLIVKSGRIQSLDRIGECFTTSYWNQPRTGLYRPLVIFSFALNHLLDGLHTRGYVAVNVLLHAGTSMAVVVLARSLGAKGLAAFAAGLLFAVHPVHTEAVTWVTGRAEVLCTFFCVLALIAHRGAARSPRRAWGWRGFAAAAFLSGLLSKEHAVTLVLAIPVLDWLAPVAKRSWRERVADYAPLLLVFGVAMGLRLAVLDNSAFGGPRYVLPLENPLVPLVTSRLGTVYGATGGERVLSAVALVGEVLRLLAWPARLSVDYSFDQLPVVRTAYESRFLLGFGIAFGALASVFALRGRSPSAAAGLAFLALTWGISSNLVRVTGTVFAERLLYLPSVGFVIVCGVAWERVRRRHGRVAWGTLAVVVLLCVGRTVVRNRDWERPLTLWRSAVEASPWSAKANALYASAILHDARGATDDAAERQIRKAEYHLGRALEIYPERRRDNMVLGRLRLAFRDAEGALECFRRAVRLGTSRKDAGYQQALRDVLVGLEPADPRRAELEAELR